MDTVAGKINLCYKMKLIKNEPNVIGVCYGLIFEVGGLVWLIVNYTIAGLVV